MKSAARFAVVLLAAALCFGLIAGVALGGKKKKKPTTVVVESTKVLTGKQNVKVVGHLQTANKCKPARTMKLLETDASGNVRTTIDLGITDANGNWKLQGKLPAVPTANDRLKVKATKRTVGKLLCKAGASPLIVIQ
jgi:hypothetical protein